MSCEGRYCDGCVQQQVGIRRIDADGLGTSGILLVGDSPWVDEIRTGKPFAGAAGGFLERLIRRLGMKRTDFIITNSMGCKPPILNWTDKMGVDACAAMRQCRPYLEDLIAKVQPKCIVTLGKVAMQQVLGLSGDLNKHHGYIHDSAFGIPVVPTFHPSFMMQGKQRFSNVVMFALRRAQEISRNGVLRAPVSYLLDPTLDEIEAYLRVNGDSPEMPLIVDIETPKSGHLDEEDRDEEDSSFTIIRVSFSIVAGSGVSVPWTEPYIGLVKRLLRGHQQVIFWNQGFDVPRLRAAGCEIPGTVIDAMWAWHWLQSDLPRGLGFVAPMFYDGPAWKHLSEGQPALYSAIDADATMRCWIGTRRELEKEGRLQSFMRHCVKTTPILERMGGTGLLLDKEAQSELKAKLESEVEESRKRILEVVPAEVCPVKVYKRKPTDKEVTEIEAACVCVEMELPTADCKKCKGSGRVTNYIHRLPFNPGSEKQVKDLMRYLKVPVPKDRKTGAETSGIKHLERLKKKHPVFGHLIEFSKREQLISTFIWPANEQGRVTTTYGFHPRTLRKSSRKVNLQNIPKRDPMLAAAVRRTLVASPGHVLIEADSEAIEAVLTAYAAGDETMLRLAKAGIHGWLTSHMVKSPIDPSLPFEELRRQCKAMKKAHPEMYEKAKRVIHGTGYGLTPYGMHDEYKEEFPTIKSAEELQQLYFSLLPKLKKWQESVRERAHRETYLDNHFGYRHRFYDVFAWDSGRQQWVLGSDGKRCIAFGPQSDASAMQTEFLLKLAEDVEALSYLRLIIHDSIVAEVPDERAEWMAERLHDVMTMPFQQLGGLSVGVEVKVGKNMADMRLWEPSISEAAASNGVCWGSSLSS